MTKSEIATTHQRIESILDCIQPLLQADGVHVELVDVRDDGVTVRMTSSRFRLRMRSSIFRALEQLLRQEIEGLGALRLA